MRRYRFWKRAVVIVSGLIILKFTLNFFTSSTTHTDKSLGDSRDYVLDQDKQPQPRDETRGLARSERLEHKKRITDSFNGKHIRNINIFDVKDTPIEHPNKEYITPLRTWTGNVSMFIHKPEVDMISSYIKDYGTWEEDFLTQIGNIFLRDKNVTFLDIGCNIGVYTLFVSKLGAKVLAIDAVQENIKLLSKSLHKANLSDHVTLILNALSDTHNNVSIKIPQGNMGGAHIDSLKTSESDNTLNTVETIVLDDLVRISGFTNDTGLIKKDEKVFIKIDIEGNEDKALMTGQTFFQTANVIGIFMEWMHHRYTRSGQTIVDILVKEGFLPYDTASMSRFLNPDQYYTWPENIFWMKR